MGGQKEQAIKDGKIFCFINARILLSDTSESKKKIVLQINNIQRRVDRTNLRVKEFVDSS